MPKFGELIATDVWAAAARTLTDISAEEIFDLPAIDAVVPTERAAVTTGGGADTFGSWSEMVDDVGTGKRLIALAIRLGFANSEPIEIEIGEGESGSEAAIGRFTLAKPAATTAEIAYVWKSLTDNARLSVRARDESASTLYMEITPWIA